MSFFYLITSYKKLVEYCRNDDRYDLSFFLVFTFQTFVLPSIPSGFHSPTPEGWMGYYLNTSFVILFYIFFYCFYYRNCQSKDRFIREVVIFSVVARVHAFLCIGVVAFIQIMIWSYLKLPKYPSSSLIYFLMYYLLFGFLMIRFKRAEQFLK